MRSLCRTQKNSVHGRRWERLLMLAEVKCRLAYITAKTGTPSDTVLPQHARRISIISPFQTINSQCNLICSSAAQEMLSSTCPLTCSGSCCPAAQRIG